MDLPKYTVIRQKVIDIAGCGGSDAKPVTESREEILAYVDALIERGDKGLYVMKALLMAADDAWEWIEIAIKYNHPGSFMSDMDLYRRALTEAWEYGGEWLARDLLHVIFEPDNSDRQN